MTQVVLGDEGGLLIGEGGRCDIRLFKPLSAVCSRDIPLCRRRNLLVTTVEHEPGDFLFAELAGQIFGALVHRQTPIFIGIEFAVFVQIFERQPVDFEKLNA